MSDIQGEIARLRLERRNLMERVFHINNQIKDVKKKCPHKNTFKGSSFEVEQYVDDEKEYREIRERWISCLDCGHRWRKQWYADEGENES